MEETFTKKIRRKIARFCSWYKELDWSIKFFSYVVLGHLIFLILWFYFDSPECWKTEILENVRIEYIGFIFDLIILGLIQSIIFKSQQRKQDIKRWKEEIDDYRGWDEKEAMYRIVGAVRRLKREGNVEIDLKNCYLAGADLSSFEMEGLVLAGANLSFTNLTKFSFEGFDLPRTIFKDANLSHANLTGANLSHANLSGSDLSHANLTDANLSHANLTGANLSHANLLRAKLNNAYLSNAIMKNADLSESDLSNALLSDYYDYFGLLDIPEEEEYDPTDDSYLFEDWTTTEEYAFVQNQSQFSSANLTGAILVGATLKNTKMGYVNLTDADLSGANLVGASLTGACLNSANLIGANVSTANLSEAILQNAVIRGNWMEKIVLYKVIGCEEIIEKYTLEEQDAKRILKKKLKK